MQSLKDAWAKAEAIWNAAFSWVGAHPKTTIVAGVLAGCVGLRLAGL